MSADTIGWIATTIFALSYFFSNPRYLRLVQALGASVWIGYGVAIHSMPPIVANSFVALLSLGSLLRDHLMQKKNNAPVGPEKDKVSC